MAWKKRKGYAKMDLSPEEVWALAMSWQGITAAAEEPFIAMEFREFVKGAAVQPGLVRKMTNVSGGVNYLILEEYAPEAYAFAVSFATEHVDPGTKFLILRHHIIATEGGSEWHLEASEKRSRLDVLMGRTFLSDLSAMFHRRVTFKHLT